MLSIVSQPMTNVDLPKVISNASHSQEDDEGANIEELSPMFEKMPMPKDIQLQSVIEYYKVIDSSARGPKELSDSDDETTPLQSPRREGDLLLSPHSGDDAEHIGDLPPAQRELPKLGARSRRFSTAEKGAHRRLSRLDLSMQHSQELRAQIARAASAGSKVASLPRVASLPHIIKREGSHTVGALKPRIGRASPVGAGAVNRLSWCKDLRDLHASHDKKRILTASPRLVKK